MNTKKVYRYDEKGYFLYNDLAYESPLEPNVYPLPANCTELEPLKAKESYKIKYNGKEWEYEEITETAPTTPEPTDEEKLASAKLQAQADVQQQLSASDYKCLKYVDGDLTATEYKATKAERKALREKYNQIEACETLEQLQELL